MTRYHMVNGVNEPFTAEEEEQRDAEETAWLVKNPIRSEAYLEAKAQIEKLESTITPRRIRDALASDAGKKWVADVEAKIAIERGKL
jgi:hypothetical protein